LEKKKHKTSGLISEDTLVRMIAADLGVGSQSEASATPELSVVDLVPGLSNVTIASSRCRSSAKDVR
jgi:hypothetical protein